MMHGTTLKFLLPFLVHVVNVNAFITIIRHQVCTERRAWSSIDVSMGRIQQRNPASQYVFSNVNEPNTSATNRFTSNQLQGANQNIFDGKEIQQPNIQVAKKRNVNEDNIPSTMSDAIIRFFFGPDHGPIITVISIILLIAYRSTTSWNLLDFCIGTATIIFWWFQEHFIHRYLLHSSWNWMGKEIHQSHHDKTYFHISIDPTPLLLGWLGAAHVILRLLLPLDLALSSTIFYAIAGMWYEWTHYIVHTKVRPKSKFMNEVKNNHIRHHIVDDKNWLGFSMPFVDNIFGTNPDIKAVRKRK